MSGLDWGILALLFLFGVAGFYRGFIVGAFSFVGFLGGAFLGTRLAPLLLPRGYSSPYAPLLGLAGALFGGALLAVGLEALGLRARRQLRFGALYLFDGVLGALLSVAVGLAVVWLMAAVLMQEPFKRLLHQHRRHQPDDGKANGNGKQRAKDPIEEVERPEAKLPTGAQAKRLQPDGKQGAAEQGAGQAKERGVGGGVAAGQQQGGKPGAEKGAAKEADEGEGADDETAVEAGDAKEKKEGEDPPVKAAHLGSL